MAKIFIGIALVITLVTAALGFLMKDNIAKMRDTVKQASADKNKAEGNLQVARTELKKAQDDVASAKNGVDDKDKEIASKTSQVETLNKQLAESKAALDAKAAEAQEWMAKANKTPDTAPPVPDAGGLPDMQKRAEKAEAELAESKQLQETVNRKLKENEARMASLEQYKRDRERQFQRPGVSGRILAVNPGWNFVVLSIGDKQGLMANSPLLVMRGGEPIAKVRVTSIETSRSIADVIPGSVRRGVTVQPGDNVVFEGSRNQPTTTTPSAPVTGGAADQPTAPLAPAIPQ